MTKTTLLKYLVPVGVLLAFSSIADATAVAPGTSGVALAATTETGTIIQSTADTVCNIAGCGAGTTLKVTYTEWVFQEAGGTLDFVIQATNNSVPGGTVIENITTANFTGSGTTTTDLGFSSTANGLPTIAAGQGPEFGSRTLDGPGVVGFDFGIVSTVPQGGQTDYLIIKTNQTEFVSGSVSFQDGVAASGPGFGVIPEPNLACVLSVFAIGIVGIAYRRKKNVAKNTEV